MNFEFCFFSNIQRTDRTQRVQSGDSIPDESEDLAKPVAPEPTAAVTPRASIITRSTARASSPACARLPTSASVIVSTPRTQSTAAPVTTQPTSNETAPASSAPECASSIAKVTSTPHIVLTHSVPRLPGPISGLMPGVINYGRTSPCLVSSNQVAMTSHLTSQTETPIPPAVSQSIQISRAPGHVLAQGPQPGRLDTRTTQQDLQPGRHSSYTSQPDVHVSQQDIQAGRLATSTSSMAMFGHDHQHSKGAPVVSLHGGRVHQAVFPATNTSGRTCKLLRIDTCSFVYKTKRMCLWVPFDINRTKESIKRLLGRRTLLSRV